MPATAVARYLTLAGLAAVSAAAAHGGAATLSNPRWVAPALAGAVIAVASMARLGATTLTAAAAARDLARGRVRHVRPHAAHRQLTLLEAAAVLVAAQASAHAALLVAGAPAHTGVAGALALHLALALVSAAVASGGERLLAAAFARLEDAIAAMLALLLRAPGPRRPRPRPAPPAGAARRLPLGRAPPLPA